MDQIISLLSKLFDLTKVASVTLPGLLAACGLALILWPAAPIDVIPAVVSMQRSFPQPTDNAPACEVQHWALDDVSDQMKRLSDQNRSSSRSCFQPVVANQQPQLVAPFDLGPNTNGANPIGWPGCSLAQIIDIEQSRNQSVPQASKRALLQQFVLDFEARNMSACANLEKSWAGEEEKVIQQLTSDTDTLEKLRSAAQENYLAYLKTGNAALAAQYRKQMDDRKHEIDENRKKILGLQAAKQERERRADELTTEQQLLKDRLGDPGRLRPRTGFDAFLTGLVNHVVGFILLSLAAAVIVTAFDRAWFGLVYEGLFHGF